MPSKTQVPITIPKPHKQQEGFINSPAKRKIIRAGRRGGKTVGSAILAVKHFLDGKRVLYAAPTSDQIDRFWTEVNRALNPAVEARALYRNLTHHIIEVPGTENRIRAKTAWNADMLRGDYADLLILDEWQMMDEATWDEVGAPMLLDTNGDAVFIYTPPSLKTRRFSKARDPQHAAKLFKRAQADESGRWAAFTFSSHENPHLSREALDEITQDMTALAYRQEVLAEDVDEIPGALWSRAIIEDHRTNTPPGQLEYVITAIDPSATSGGDEAGIITAGISKGFYYVLEDNSVQGSPLRWATEAVEAYARHQANLIVAESNNGGEMVSTTLNSVEAGIPVKLIHASRGKATRAEPVSALYERGLVKHVGNYPELEDEMCLWLPGDESPNRMDALVWAITELSRTARNRKVARMHQG